MTQRPGWPWRSRGSRPVAEAPRRASGTCCLRKRFPDAQVVELEKASLILDSLAGVRTPLSFVSG